jgi:hypothetical protein
MTVNRTEVSSTLAREWQKNTRGRTLNFKLTSQKNLNVDFAFWDNFEPRTQRGSTVLGETKVKLQLGVALGPRAMVGEP